MELIVGGYESLVSLKGKAHHRQAVMVVGESLACLPGILGRDKEPHLISAKLPACCLGKLHMGKVDRVECSSEKNDFQSYEF